VHPVAGSHESTVHELPSSHWLAVVQPSATVVVGEVEVVVLVVERVVEVEDVVWVVEVEEEVLVVVGGRVVEVVDEVVVVVS